MPRRTVLCEPSTSRGSSSAVSQMEVDSDSENPNQEMLVNDFVKYVVNNSSKKHSIKRNEVCKTLKIPAKSFTHILNEGSQVLEDIYGIKITEVEEIKTTKSYITFSSIKTPTVLMFNSETSSDLKMLFIILSYIFMQSKEIQEITLHNFLKKLNIDLDDFGKAIEKFVKQLYLKRRKHHNEAKNITIIYYSWGQRALLEFNKKDVLATVAKLVKKNPVNFTVQYKELYGNDYSMDE